MKDVSYGARMSWTRWRNPQVAVDERSWRRRTSPVVFLRLITSSVPLHSIWFVDYDYDDYCCYHCIFLFMKHCHHLFAFCLHVISGSRPRSLIVFLNEPNMKSFFCRVRWVAMLVAMLLSMFLYWKQCRCFSQDMVFWWRCWQHRTQRR